MIYGMIAFSIISYYLNSYYTGVLISYPIQEQVRDLFPFLTLAIVMGLAVYVAGLLPFNNYWTMLLAQITIGFVVYVCLCRMFRLAAFMEIWRAGWNKSLFLSRDVR